MSWVISARRCAGSPDPSVVRRAMRSTAAPHLPHRQGQRRHVAGDKGCDRPLRQPEEVVHTGIAVLSLKIRKADQAPLLLQASFGQRITAALEGLHLDSIDRFPAGVSDGALAEIQQVGDHGARSCPIVC